MSLFAGILVLLAAASAVILALRLRKSHRHVLRLQDRVQRLEREAGRVEEAKRRFLTSITHELRTPLTAIMGYQELLADGLYGDLDTRFRRPVERIGSAAEHLLHLIDGVLELARLDTGQMELNLGPVATRDVLLASLDGVRSVAEDQSVSIEPEIPGHLPMLTTDSERLERTVGLALIAAIRASNGARLRLRAVAEAEDDGAVRLAIEGTGLALDQYSPERVFGGFDGVPKGEEVTSRTGLRLSIARRLARALGGDLAIEPGAEGTTLRLRICDAPHLVKAAPPD